MVRQAHSYLVGAVSGTALIAAAVIVFVLLVSAQAFRDWPLTGFPSLSGDGDGAGSVATGQPAAGGGTTAGSGAATAGAPGGGTANGAADSPGNRGVAGQTGGAGAPAAGSPVAGSPAGSPTASNPGSGSAPASGSGASGSGGGSGGKSTSGGGPSPSGQVTGAVNDTVTGVDKATGGALGETGITKVTEGVVNGAAGPESAVGKTVDEAGEAVGGLLPQGG
jgi:hypothetical protein